MAAAKQKVEGPYKVVQTESGQWKVVYVSGQHPPLEIVEQRRLSGLERLRNPRPVRPGMEARPAFQPQSEEYWAQQRELAGKDVTRDIDGTKLYDYRQAAYRRCLQLNKQYQENLQASYEEEKEDDMFEEGESVYIPLEEVKKINILRGTFGCPSGDHAGIDPYYDRVDWNEAARGDGGSYSVLETVTRLENETFDDFYARVDKRAGELNTELDCSRCRW